MITSSRKGKQWTFKLIYRERKKKLNEKQKGKEIEGKLIILLEH